MALYFLTKSPIYDHSMMKQKTQIVCDSQFMDREKLIKSQNPSLHDLKFIDLPVDQILHNIENTPEPEEISTSVFHKQRYDILANKNVLTYDKFCHLEKDIANIIDEYALDKKHHWCIFLHKNFLYADSFRRFLSKPAQKKILWISDSVEVGFPDMIMWTDEFSSHI